MYISKEKFLLSVCSLWGVWGEKYFLNVEIIIQKSEKSIDSSQQDQLQSENVYSPRTSERNEPARGLIIGACAGADSTIANTSPMKKFENKDRNEMIADVPNKIQENHTERLLTKIGALSKELSEKIAIIETKDLEIAMTNRRIQNYIGFLLLNFEFQDNIPAASSSQLQSHQDHNNNNNNVVKSNAGAADQSPPHLQQQDQPHPFARVQDNNNNFRPIHIRKGYFLFDIKELVIVKCLGSSDRFDNEGTTTTTIPTFEFDRQTKQSRDYRFAYDRLSNVSYKSNNKTIELTWVKSSKKESSSNPSQLQSSQEQSEQLNVKFENEEQMNKFDMLLYLLTLNNSVFNKGNHFNSYFDHVKNPLLPNPLLRNWKHDTNTLLSQNNSEIFNLKPTEFNSMHSSFSQKIQQQQQLSESKAIVSQKMKNEIQLNLNKIMLQSQLQESTLLSSRVLNNGFVVGGSCIISDDGQQQQQQQQQQNAKSHRMTPLNSERGMMMSSYSAGSGFATIDGVKKYDQMRDPRFWERQVTECVNLRHHSVLMIHKNKFRETFQLRIDSNSGSHVLFLEDLTKLRVYVQGVTEGAAPTPIAAGTNTTAATLGSSSQRNMNVNNMNTQSSNGSSQAFVNKVIVESKEEKKNRCEIVMYDAQKKEYFCSLLRFFCTLNTMKTKEIQSTILYLEQGVILLKFSKASLSPHEKLFFYRFDEEKNEHYFISKLPGDTNPRNQKITLFSDIKSMTKKWMDGPGFRSFQKDDPRIVDELAIVINLSSGKTIEVLAKSNTLRDQFYNALNLVRTQLSFV